MLLRLPDSWPPVVIAGLAMVTLAVLDLAGSFAAKEAVDRRSPAMAVAGALCFLLLFWVYTSSLQYAELAPVTFGWIVILQVGIVVLDRVRYGSPLGTWKLLAIALIVVGEAALLLAPSTPRVDDAAGAPSPRPPATSMPVVAARQPQDGQDVPTVPLPRAELQDALPG